ncbi:hypothetical protein Esti_003459 [Eimeria stiedai]
MARVGLSGFSEAVNSAAVTGTCVKQTTPTGETYVVNVATGEKVIPGSMRPDGTLRKPIKVRPGYTPVEERRTFRTRQQLSREEHAAHVGTSIPGLTPVESGGPPKSMGSSKPRNRKKNGAGGGGPSPSKPTKAAEATEALADQLKEKLAVSKGEGEAAKASDPSKRLRNVKKKLNEIHELETKVAEGVPATTEQLENHNTCYDCGYDFDGKCLSLLLLVEWKESKE